MQGAQATRARMFARLSVAGGVLALLIAALAPAPAVAAPSGSFTMDPPAASLNLGDTVSVTLDLNNAVDVNRVNIAVTYNTAVLEVIDADAGTPGVQILPGPFPGDETAGSVLQNSVSGGTITYQYQLNGVAVAAGTGTVATVQFATIAEGNGNIAWTAHQLVDGNGATMNAPATPASIVVGGPASPVPTSTPPPQPTDTPAPTQTPPPTATGVPTDTPVETSTAPAATSTFFPTHTPRPTSTPRITVVDDSNERSGPRVMGPAHPERARGLPDAGVEGPGIQWWRWTFFAAALLLGAAGWFYTFALHYGDREAVLLDRHDRRRRRRY
jgi:hypothetical protein